MEESFPHATVHTHSHLNFTLSGLEVPCKEQKSNLVKLQLRSQITDRNIMIRWCPRNIIQRLDARRLAMFCPLMSKFEIRFSRFSSDNVLDKEPSEPFTMEPKSELEALVAAELLGSEEDFATK